MREEDREAFSLFFPPDFFFFIPSQHPNLTYSHQAFKPAKMPASKGKKRARANTAGNALDQPPARGLPTKPIVTASEVATLDPAMISTLLLKAAKMYPAVNNMLIDAIESAKKSRQSRVVTFDGYSSSIWKQINVTYRSASGSKQYGIAFDVVRNINSSIEEILKQCDQYPNPETRFNALSVLRKIGKTIFLPANDTLGRQVQKEFVEMNEYVDAMQHVVSAMSDEERALVVSDAMWPKLQELKLILDEEVLSEDFQNVLDLLKGVEDDDGDDYDDYDDEEGVEEEESD